VYTGVSQGTISQILQKNHIPRIESLLRLADSLDTDRVEVLRLAGYLRMADELLGAPAKVAEEDRETREMIEAFRRLPVDWRPEAIAAVQMLVRLARRVGEGVVVDQIEEK
jgi:transcriptional regulator with XRE-family HTH domain